ncbi:unnamed protein product [Amoebophrya sp. A25]|nr:unnamed protein product [Amoebophrya sp. A25]|eukprot:GSA25T00007081001.1
MKLLREPYGCFRWVLLVVALAAEVALGLAGSETGFVSGLFSSLSGYLQEATKGAGKSASTSATTTRRSTTSSSNPVPAQYKQVIEPQRNTNTTTKSVTIDHASGGGQGLSLSNPEDDSPGEKKNNRAVQAEAEDPPLLLDDARTPMEISMTTRRSFSRPSLSRGDELVAIPTSAHMSNIMEEHEVEEDDYCGDDAACRRRRALSRTAFRTQQPDHLSLTAEQSAFAYDKMYEWNGIFMKQRFLGMKIQQHPLDAWILQELLWDTRPDLIIETGTYNGGSALYYASLLDMIQRWGWGEEGDEEESDEDVGDAGRKGKCWSSSSASAVSQILTIDPRHPEDLEISRDSALSQKVTKHPLWKRHVTFMQGSSIEPGVVAKVRAFVEEFRRKFEGKRRTRPPRIMVVLDSDHEAPHVWKEMQAYWDLVSVGQYLIVQDTHLDFLYEGTWRHDGRQWLGPARAVSLFFDHIQTRNASRHFVVDKSREYLVLSQHRGGYLWRKK